MKFSRQDLKVYLASGYLIFTKPIAGVRLGAAFATDAEGGDAEVVLLPPSRSERQSLAQFTNSPNLDEHFKFGAFVFTDGSAEELLSEIRSNPSDKKSPEAGELLAARFSDTLRSLCDGFETRLVYDVLSAAPTTTGGSAGLFYMGVSGNQLGTFDVVYDPSAEDQISAGRLARRDDRTYFDVWTTFPARSVRNGAPAPVSAFALGDFRIDASIANDLAMDVITRATLTLHKPTSVVPFSLSRKMQVTSASIDGQPAEVFDHESVGTGVAAPDDRTVLLVSENPLDTSTAHEIEVRHHGAVIQRAGDSVYYVASRGTWYPHIGLELAKYDLTFRYPKNLVLVTGGTAVEDRTEDASRITRHKFDLPVRLAGFNLGNFQSLTVEQAGYRIEVYANRSLENALRPAPQTAAQQPPPAVPRARRRLQLTPPPDSEIEPPRITAPDPAARIHQLANSVVQALEFMTAEFGPAPVRNLAVTPIPGRFGQGFPGLIYLSTLAYLNPEQRPAGAREYRAETFFSELLETHEIAHQWWGNLIVPATYHDDWLIEALANYSALLLLEKNKGSKAMDRVLDEYKAHLTAKDESGKRPEAAGPITWGYRLESSLAPNAWQAVTYEKGTWIIHMLRRRMGDERFFGLLHELCERYRLKSVTTEQFRDLARQFMPAQSPDHNLTAFFENWVYGTGIPSVKLSYQVRGFKVNGTLVQRDVDDDFSALVPVEVQSGGRKTVYWLPTGSDPVPFSIALKALPTKVALLTTDCLAVSDQ